MSRFETYINEDFKEDVKYIINTIRKHCKPFLREWKVSSGFVYRGTKMVESIDGIEVKRRRKNRNPSNTPHFITKKIDDEFDKKFGWKPRTQGIFTTGNSKVAIFYGVPQLFFPIGKYEYLWSPKVKDFYSHRYIDDYLGSLDYLDSLDSGEDRKEFTEKWVKETIDLYTSKGLNKAIKSGKEIMFGMNKYLIVDRKYEFMLKDEL